jgi:hypothetical protein
MLGRVRLSAAYSGIRIRLRRNAAPTAHLAMRRRGSGYHYEWALGFGLAGQFARFRPQVARSMLKLGSYDHVALELPGNPLGLRPDELVFEKSDSTRTAAIFANVSGTRSA